MHSSWLCAPNGAWATEFELDRDDSSIQGLHTVHNDFQQKKKKYFDGLKVHRYLRNT